MAERVPSSQERLCFMERAVPSCLGGGGGVMLRQDVDVDPVLWYILNALFNDAVNCYDYIAS
jgi:hypothetical protein